MGLKQRSWGNISCLCLSTGASGSKANSYHFLHKQTHWQTSYVLDVHILPSQTILAPPCEHPTWTTICHQNIHGWENFLQGFVSKRWAYAQLEYDNKTSDTQRNWTWKLIRGVLELHQQIWEDRNNVVHRKGVEDLWKKLLIQTQNRVRKAYDPIPNLISDTLQYQQYPSVVETTVATTGMVAPSGTPNKDEKNVITTKGRTTNTLWGIQQSAGG